MKEAVCLICARQVVKSTYPVKTAGAGADINFTIGAATRISIAV